MTDTKQSELLSLRINVEGSASRTIENTYSSPSNQSEEKIPQSSPQHMPSSDSSDIQCYCEKTLEMNKSKSQNRKCDECRELIESENFYYCDNKSYHCGDKFLCVKCVHNHEPPKLQIYGKNVPREMQRFSVAPYGCHKNNMMHDGYYSDIICDGCSNIIKGEEFVYPIHQFRLGSYFCQQCADEPPDRDMDKVVSTLQEDIWSMAYVMIKSGSGLRCSFLLLMIFVYIIQLMSLGLLIWGYMFSLRHDVIIPYKISEENIMIPFEMYTDENGLDTVNDTLNFIKLDTSHNTLNLIESPAKYQKYTEPNHATDHPTSSFLFGLSSLMSMLLLSFYLFSTFTNQAVMLTIAAREEKEEFHDNYNKYRCGGISFFRCCCKVNKVSSLLRLMAWSNVLLSLGACGIGMVILSFYSLYFGIQNPTDIIFTPISIVFILEIDDWAFNIAKNYYTQCYDEELWTLKVKDFQLFDFNRMYYKSAGLIHLIWGGATYLCIIIVVWYNLNARKEATDDIWSALSWQNNLIMFATWSLTCIVMWRYIPVNLCYCCTNCCNKTIVEDGKGNK